MLRVSHEDCSRVPDVIIGEDPEYGTPSIRSKSFDKAAYSNTYSPVLPHGSDSCDGSDQDIRSGTRWYNVSSWRTGGMLSSVLATRALVLNVSIVIWASRAYRIASAIVEVLQAECKEVQKANIWIHLGINTISTALLGGSNYCMQCLSARTRKEVNKTHTKGRWADIEMASVRDLRSISWRNVCCWWFLGLSSIPLHLL